MLHMTNQFPHLFLSHKAFQIAKKHESYTSAAISGAQDSLVESERVGKSDLLQV